MSKTHKLSNSMKGMLLALFASTSWGLAGVITQFVSQNQAIPALWFLSTRTTFAGIILIVVSAIIYRGKIFNIFKTWQSTLLLVVYGVFGLAANMGSYYVAIQMSNAAAATILQYLAPLFILLGSVIFMHKKLSWVDASVFVIALIGVALAVTNGNFTQLNIKPMALFWGLISGITAALYVVLPRKLAVDNSPIVVMGWGTLVASVFFNIIHPIWHQVPTLHMGGVLGIAGVILFGTLLTFPSLIFATRFTTSEVISLCDAAQPVATIVLTAILTAVGVFHDVFGFWEIVGVVFVIIAIYILQYYQRKGDPANQLK